jgi:hypothetical protein
MWIVLAFFGWCVECLAVIIRWPLEQRSIHLNFLSVQVRCVFQIDIQFGAWDPFLLSSIFALTLQKLKAALQFLISSHSVHFFLTYLFYLRRFMKLDFFILFSNFFYFSDFFPILLIDNYFIWDDFYIISFCYFIIFKFLFLPI